LYYESDSSVEADEDTDTKVGGDTGMGPEVGGIAKPRRKTRAAAAKQSATTAPAKARTVKAVEKKKRKRKASPSPAVEMPVIPMPPSREVESDDEEEDEAIEEPPVAEERSVRRSLSPAAKRQRELVQKTMEDALRQGLEAQRAVAATQANMPVLNRPRIFRPKPRVPTITR
jgi:hypothetical protein